MELSHSKERDAFKLVNIRGPQLKLPTHKEACSQSELISYHKEHAGEPLAVDLFSGAGGLSLGLQRAGFRLVVGVDRNSFAIGTHASYFPGVSIVKDISTEDVLDELLEPLRGRRIDLLAGGPPCQPFSKPARWIRSVTSDGSGSMRDHRRELWRSFLYAAQLLRPRAILIENVTDIATNEDGLILRAIFSKLEELDYSFDCRTYFAYDLGVPQHRQRLFVVAFKNPSQPFNWPEPATTKGSATLRNAISDLPPLRGGWNEPTPRYGGPQTQFQKALREGFARDDMRLPDHMTRDVRKDDLTAFLLLTDKTKYYDLPEELRRYGTGSFVDKYKRLSWDEPCRGITAHIGKDGYWYIHPDQHRSLSIREAARVQSFPDRFRFAGFRTSALRQIGEAVPPFVAEVLGRKIREHLGSPSKEAASHGRSKQTNKRVVVRHLLRLWYEREANSLHPWRLERSLWLNLLGEILFADRSHRGKAILFWGNCKRDWPEPKSFLKDKHRESHLRTLGMSDKLALLESLAAYLRSAKLANLKELLALGVNERLARRAMAITGHTDERPNEAPLIRVANRVFEQDGSREMSVESQIATAMLVGEDDGAILYTAAIELGEGICSISNPTCMLCALAKCCSHYMHGGTPPSDVARARRSRKARAALSQVMPVRAISLTIRSLTLRGP